MGGRILELVSQTRAVGTAESLIVTAITEEPISTYRTIV